MPPTIAYIMSRFPHLSETFILREMIEIQQHGWRVALYPLILQEQAVAHASTFPWRSQARRLPFLSLGLLGINRQEYSRDRRLYTMLWRRIIRENRLSPQDLIRAIALLPKAVYAAHLMRQEGINHIHAHYATYPALVAWIIHHLTGISYSMTVHAHDIFVRTTMLSTKLRDAAFVAAISQYNRHYLTRVVGPWIQDKTHVVHCGISPQHYQPRTDFYGSGKRFEIMSIGSLQPYKGFPYLLRACAILRDRGIPLHCRIVGGGEENTRLKRIIATNGLDNIVELLGPLPQETISQLLLTAHCYVQPSIIMPSGKMEGIPVALMEALACELPVVATQLSGIPELVRPGVTGFLTPPANTARLADAIETVYRDPQQAVRLARQGRNLVLQDFNLHTNVARLSTLFDHTIRSQPHRECTYDNDTITV